MKRVAVFVLLSALTLSSHLRAQPCNVVAGVLTLAADETCSIERDHPSILQGLIMGENSTLVVRNPPDGRWRIHIRGASFAPGSRWDLRGSNGVDWTGGPPSSQGQAGYCEDARDGRQGRPGGDGGDGVGLEMIIGIRDLQEWRIDGSGGSGGRGGPGGKGGKGGAARCCCSSSGDGGDGGRGGPGGRGGDTSEIKVTYYYLPAGASELADKLSATRTFEESLEAIASTPLVEHSFPGGLNIDSQAGSGGAGGSGGPGGKRGERKCGCLVCGCTGRGSNGSTGPSGRTGGTGTSISPQFVLINPPTTMRDSPFYVDPSEGHVPASDEEPPNPTAADGREPSLRFASRR